MVPHLDEERVAAGHDERDEREDRLGLAVLAGVGQPGRVDVALEVVHPEERLVVDPGEGLGEVDADEERAGEPRPVRDGDRVDVRPVTPASAQASSRTGTIQRRWARAATSGTMPPVAAWRATWLATTLARMRRPPSMSAIPVSSQLARWTGRAGRSCRPVRGRWGVGGPPPPGGRRGRRRCAVDRGPEPGQARPHPAPSSGSVVMMRASSLLSV